MEAHIENKVAKSSLITLNLDDYAPSDPIFTIDIKPWLRDGLILIERDFRDVLKSHDWNLYRGGWVSITPLEDAIVPAWAYILAASYLSGIAKKTMLSSRRQLLDFIWQNTIDDIDVRKFTDKPVIVKGCSENVPHSAYVAIVGKIQPVVKSIFYGEACSSVPIYKKRKI